jgi:hypothetical protein
MRVNNKGDYMTTYQDEIALDERLGDEYMNYLNSCRVKDRMRENRIEFYNRLGRYVKEPLLMHVGQILIDSWVQDPELVEALSDRLGLEEAHWRALNDDAAWTENDMVEEDKDNRDDDADDFDW